VPPFASAGRTRMLPSALLTASASQPGLISELNLHGLLLCCVRFDTHQSPDEWQHSLPACSLALTGRDLHPLDFSKWFPLLHCWFLQFHAFRSATGATSSTISQVCGVEFWLFATGLRSRVPQSLSATYGDSSDNSKAFRFSFCDDRSVLFTWCSNGLTVPNICWTNPGRNREGRLTKNHRFSARSGFALARLSTVSG
jgi:hypothetical protein